MKHREVLASLILLFGMFAQYAWREFPADWQADVWNASQAAVIMLLCALVAVSYGGYVLIVCALLAAFNLLTFSCSIAWLIRPWEINPGDEQCSAALNLPLGLIGGAVALLICAKLFRG